MDPAKGERVEVVGAGPSIPEWRGTGQQPLPRNSQLNPAQRQSNRTRGTAGWQDAEDTQVPHVTEHILTVLGLPRCSCTLPLTLQIQPSLSVAFKLPRASLNPKHPSWGDGNGRGKWLRSCPTGHGAEWGQRTRAPRGAFQELFGGMEGDTGATLGLEESFFLQ